MAMAMSPRISFSHDVDLSIDSHHPLDDSTLPNDDDFDFILDSHISYIQDPSPADELFSQGKLLPLSSVMKPAATAPPPSAPPKSSPKKTQLKDLILSGSPSPKPRSSNNSKPPSSPFWSMGRSISVGASRTTSSSKSSYFPRSKSTGSYQGQNQRGKSNCYYYSGSGNSGGCGNGVRINPVINVPAPFIPRGGSGGSSSSSTNSSSGSGHNAANSSFFAYLLCHCSSKNSREIETGYSS